MKQERLLQVLNFAVEKGFISNLAFDEVRKFEFKVSLTTCYYKIEWWCNICYLTTACGAYIPFHNVEISGTWPNHHKTNLQFEYNGNKCVIVPVEKYEKGEG